MTNETHYAHIRRVPALPDDDADCRCIIHSAPPRRPSKAIARELRVELVLERIELDLAERGETSIMGVWNALTRWRGRGTGPPPDPPRELGTLLDGPALIAVVRGVFRSLDQHHLITPVRFSADGRCLAWRDANRLR